MRFILRMMLVIAALSVVVGTGLRARVALFYVEPVVPAPDVAGQEGIERGLGTFQVSEPNQQVEQDTLKREANQAEPECFT